MIQFDSLKGGKNGAEGRRRKCTFINETKIHYSIYLNDERK